MSLKQQQQLSTIHVGRRKTVEKKTVIYSVANPISFFFVGGGGGRGKEKDTSISRYVRRHRVVRGGRRFCPHITVTGGEGRAGPVMAASECDKGAFGRVNFFPSSLLSSSIYLVYKSMIAFFSKKQEHFGLGTYSHI